MSLRSRRSIAALVLGVAALLVAPSAGAAAPADDCPDGVAVVVDFTDVGGEVEVGCAEGDPGSGREALEGAGFTPTDSVPGMICAVDSRPDPCPEEFDGSFWSYWTTDGDEWVAHLEGADSVDPAPGDVEGWRYNDGATGPGIAPTELSAATGGAGAAAGEAPATADDDAADDGAARADGAEATTGTATDDAATAETDADAAEDDGSGAAAVWFVVAGVAVVAAVIALVLRRRQR